MALATYKAKRNFKKTTEPSGSKKTKSASLAFVVQEHSATNLHYDFRLEMEGVLKSWAVPKGPSMNPDDKRLAMMVEDHPYDYKDFEGTIPEGNYGAGNVIVWDRGTYHAWGNTNAKESEKILLAGLKKGHITFILKGKKLKGEFALVKLKNGKGNAWLLIKKNDEFATKSDILKKDKSVKTGKKLALRLRSKNSQKKSQVHKTEPNQKKENRASKKDLRSVKPMKAELAEEPFNDKDWIFEIKYDGYRVLAAIDGKGDVELYSRNLLSFNSAYKSIVEELEKIDHVALLDGEVVVEDEEGRSHFQLLQNYQKENKGPLKYYVFDLLNLDGNDLTGLPLIQRKELLKILLKKYKFINVHYSDHIEEKGKDFFKAAIKKNLEGIIGKKASSLYQVGKRSGDWLKIKISNEQEAVIVGITESRGSRKHFGSLLLGAYHNDTLEYIGHCGTGFNQGTLKELYEKFKPYFKAASPFDKKVRVNAKVQWMKPHFVCQVKFTEWTSDGSMRHPVFLGLRTDKKPVEVKKEIPEAMKSDMTSKKNSDSNKDYDLKVGKTTLKLTNQNKIYFPEDKITKGDLVEYYKEISTVILPYLKDRPESLNRFPNGIHSPSFFQKDMDKEKIPKWIQTEKVYSESNSKYIDYLICNDKATLIYLANLGCIEINPWNSRISNPENPDWMVIDLDPEKISFMEVVNAALEVRKVLEEMDIDCYCKTSGATGMHVYIPLGAKYDYDIVRNFAQLVAQLTNERLPDTTSVLRLPSKRQGKVYLDFLQNRRGQTLAAPYSARPKVGATVSTPLEWKEVNKKLDPSQFTIKNILKRIEKKGDLWKPVLGKGANLDKALKAIH